MTLLAQRIKTWLALGDGQHFRTIPRKGDRGILLLRLRQAGQDDNASDQDLIDALDETGHRLMDCGGAAYCIHPK